MPKIINVEILYKQDLSLLLLLLSKMRILHLYKVIKGFQSFQV